MRVGGIMKKMNSKEALVVSGLFGGMIGGVFMAFGNKSNFLCEMLFWMFVLYVVELYLEIVPNVVKNMIKKYVFLTQCLISLAWVPLFVGGMIVMFLGSLLFVDYSLTQLNVILAYSKIVLFVLMILSVGVLSVKKSECFRFIHF